MKKIILLVLAIIGIATTHAAPKKELYTCGICLQVPKKKLSLPCEHTVCIECLPSWLDEKVVCLQCKKRKQQKMKKGTGWQTLSRVGFGMAVVTVIIGIKAANEYLDSTTTHL
jgi:hypothetical protein